MEQPKTPAPCPKRDVPKLPTFRYAHPFVCALCGKTAEQPGELCLPLERGQG
jgi:hypothetical protein